jgi:hypothetical protein
VASARGVCANATREARDRSLTTHCDLREKPGRKSWRVCRIAGRGKEGAEREARAGFFWKQSFGDLRPASGAWDGGKLKKSKNLWGPLGFFRNKSADLTDNF